MHNQTQLCFRNTMDIAFSLRKKQFVYEKKYNFGEDLK